MRDSQTKKSIRKHKYRKTLTTITVPCLWSQPHPGIELNRSQIMTFLFLCVLDLVILFSPTLLCRFFKIKACINVSFIHSSINCSLNDGNDVRTTNELE